MSDLTPFIEELRSRLLVSDVLRPYVTLSKKGREYQACCPFHMEKTPSFTVNDDKGFYHCFGCGAHGDVVRFYTDYLKLPFIEALEKLAALAGLQVPKRQQVSTIVASKDIYEALKKAQDYFTESLFTPKGYKALEYIKKRGLSERDLKAFGLGYSPDSGLFERLTTLGFTASLIQRAGLTVQTESKNPFDKFKNRLMFPILNQKGVVIAFGGRSLDGRDPKYLNSPETEVFHKGRNLYGLNLVDLKHQTILVVEGYMDVIAVNQGYKPIAVAPLGTALTQEQLELLWKKVPAPILCFDGDMAGKRAAKRALEKALPFVSHTKTLRFIELPSSHDPDSFIREKGVSEFEKLLTSALSLSDKLWRSLLESYPLKTPEDKSTFLKKIEEYCTLIQDPTTSKFYFNDLKSKFYESIKTFGKNFSKKTAQPSWILPPSLPKNDILEKKILVILLRHPKLIEKHFDELMKGSFTDQTYEQLRQVLLDICCENLENLSHNLNDILRQHGFEEIVQTLLKTDIVDKYDFDEEKDTLQLVQLFEAFYKIQAQEEVGILTQEAKLQQDENAWSRLKAYKLLHAAKE